VSEREYHTNKNSPAPLHLWALGSRLLLRRDAWQAHSLAVLLLLTRCDSVRVPVVGAGTLAILLRPAKDFCVAVHTHTKSSDGHVSCAVAPPAYGARECAPYQLDYKCTRSTSQRSHRHQQSAGSRALLPNGGPWPTAGSWGRRRRRCPSRTRPCTVPFVSVRHTKGS